jgi:osmotically-inducible protein OsmY
VDDARVRLSGTVGSAAEKSRAITRSWVRGVEAVDAEGLEVAYWARDEDLRSGKYVTRSDREIRDAIQDALLRDPRVFLYGIDVDVENGVATLDGTVGTLYARRAAAGVARGTVGVWRVRNELAVTPPEDANGAAEVGAAVRGAIERDPYLEPYEITVRAGEDIVTLDGTVETRFEKARAERVASQVPGVASVVNGLRVSAPASPLPADPYVDDWRREDFAWEPPRAEEPPPVRGDRDLAESVHDELWWSPFVDADDVTVTVDDGVVTLTGTVDTWTEREAAEENALEGGALRVVNRLDVDFGPPS